jgi:hypothetical protein
MPFPIHPHMLRHACGFKLANDGQDTRALQHYLGHKNIQHTVRYTELSPCSVLIVVLGIAGCCAWALSFGLGLMLCSGTRSRAGTISHLGRDLFYRVFLYLAASEERHQSTNRS